ncbi:putative AAA-ATPase [Halanaerobium saccharolyticum]|uniref:Putative AAA-ATPase n=1 Tax=Halanaerobium saccharolyticum TaxID=43595 RepID=A0A4R7Z4J0_9FIRM|nr:putative AAA-ATPase [Halanaerobium saccharolyticum]TDW05435.1 putative AAA-ATPase [Halanaerobium saccharolyticum]TDX62950.1 putative AAA-ATPase [Halanaerobium saccharolyticum]
MGYSLESAAKKYNLKLETDTAPRMLKNLILKLYQKFDKKVVILIDEYDKPVFASLIDSYSYQFDFEKYSRFQKSLKSFYQNLEELAEYLEKVYLTGIIKFGSSSIFPDSINLVELDQDPEFAELPGFTEAELDEYLTPYFSKLKAKYELTTREAKKTFKEHYFGYRFTEKNIKVYNPFAAARVLDFGSFDNHWFNSGSPKLLFHLIQRKDFSITKFEDLRVEKSKLNPSSIKELTLIPFMYQTGYLTIKEISAEGLVKLSFPNFEVESNFLINLLDFMTEDKINTVDIYYLRKSLVQNDKQQFKKYLNSIIDDLKEVEINESESVKEFYQQIFYLIAKALSSLYLKISSQILNTEESVEFKAKTEDNHFLLSFHYGQDEETFRQLKAESETEKDSTYISINFDLQQRELAEVEIKS